MIPNRPALAAGTILRGTYVLQGRLATGGMGEVHAATHVRLPGRFAVKVLARNLARDPVAVARFCREAAIASLLRHPHVVQVVDFASGPDEVPFLVMEHLPGRDLAQHLLGGPLAVDRVAAIIGQIACALAAAHRLGIVHRDLKPANVMLVEYEGLPDFAKVLDFGVSTIAGADPGQRTVLGTPAYMAPEQAEGRGEEVDARTDQFSLAVLAHVLLTGEPPFPGETTAAVLDRILSAEPILLADRVCWPSAALDEVLGRALSKRPAARFARIGDFADAFARAAATVDPRAARVRPRSRFQGRSGAAPTETLSVHPDAPRGGPNGQSGSEDVTIDAYSRTIGASMAGAA